mgnify:CR=1 FL=1
MLQWQWPPREDSRRTLVGLQPHSRLKTKTNRTTKSKPKPKKTLVAACTAVDPDVRPAVSITFAPSPSMKATKILRWGKGAPGPAFANRALAEDQGYVYEAIPGTGHMLQIQKPEECRRAMLSFLEEKGIRC